ncbi:UNVERIFIED_CONTAM: hypothetical protein PYX00_005343 [Menopon gallinae]|uniref:Uncharacterized protein n=1 Tax=Menopon gallinae TaxID=328185 RepID=A0AAW2HR16_9NEOP
MEAIGGVAVFLALLLAQARGWHPCERQCLPDEQPKNCYYQFTLGVSHLKCVHAESEECQRRMAMSINGYSPGPYISVCENDVITVDVKNILPAGMEASIHWHGLRQRGTPFMDGTPMVTQCPIHSGTTFTYRMKADRPGTFYYHAHSVSQQLDGLYGALIVRRGPETREKVMLLAPQLQQLTSFRSSPLNDLTVSDLKLTEHHIGNGSTTERIRLINAAALDCPLSIISDTVITALDGNPIKPTDAHHFLLYPGERMDIVPADLTILGRNMCDGYTITENIEAPVPEIDLPNYYNQFRSVSPIKLDKEAQRIYVPFDVTHYPHQDNDFRYKLGEVLSYTPPFIGDAAQFANLSFAYPSSPILTQREEVDDDMICTLERRARRCDSIKFCECVQILTLPYNTSVDLVLIDEGRNGNTDQVLHLHGYSFHLLAMSSFEEPVTADKIKSLIDLNLNLVKPIEKDTIVVPRKGYSVLRLKTDNPGYWLLESVASKARSGIGLEMLVHVPDPSGPLPVPKNFPRCRSLKPQDMVFMDE